jgi:hypothetical protein
VQVEAVITPQPALFFLFKKTDRVTMDDIR